MKTMDLKDLKLVEQKHNIQHATLAKWRNEHICRRLEIAPIGDKMGENQLRWFRYVQCKPLNTSIRQVIGT